MPTEAVWVIITIPKKEYERELRKLKNQNYKNNNNNFDDDAIETRKRQKENEITFEKVLSDTLQELKIENVVWVPTRDGNYFQVYFPCDLYDNDPILNVLKSKGIGIKSETSIGFIPFSLFFYREESDDEDVDTFDENMEYTLPGDPSGRKIKLKKKPINGFKQAAKSFLDSVTSRLTVAQVVEGVRNGAEINFDFCCYVLMAAFVCSFGLIANDAVNIGASMMIEGIMGTVTAMGFAVVIHDMALFKLGAKNLFIACLMSIFHGWWIGMIIFIWMHEWNPPPDGTWPTPQQWGRGTYWGLIYGVMIAFPCGGGIAVTLLNANSCAVVGIALASTFMPPMVNCGQLWALACHLQIRGIGQPIIPYNISGTIYHMKPSWAPQSTYHPIYSYDMRYENTLLGCVSMALTALNVVFLWLGCVIVLWIKQIVPLEKMGNKRGRFFTTDIAIYKEYQDKNAKSGRSEPIGRQILKEWADITGVDKEHLFDDSPEARITRLQTLHDIARDVEVDDTYQRIATDIRPEKNFLIRRLTQPDIKNQDIRDSDHYSPAWNIGQELSSRGNRYTVNQSFREAGDDSPYSSINSGRGYKPKDLRTELGRRQSKVELRRTLRESPHSPYSIYPRDHSRTTPDSMLDRQDVRRRTVNDPIRNSNIDSTAF